ncbi:hypothetical protein NDU88_006878 [Pleurodeles waltl]|uniref:Uncharacterized protein n=1 Tax=Pleurodeles waltl TaxID=8319 RepID=A0AAV7NUS5_PLEWA|nr:hypothetical protein NDU88_006878 [Pleurodeles waltl]
MRGSRLRLSQAIPGSNRFSTANRRLFILSVHLRFFCSRVLRARPEGRAARAPHTALARAQHPPPKPIAWLQLSSGSGEGHQGAPQCHGRHRRPQGQRIPWIGGGPRAEL